MFATGATDGFVNLYKFGQDKVEKLTKFPLAGCINAMKFSADCNSLLCAQAPDQRLGRWLTQKKVKGGVTLFTNILSSTDE